MKLRNVLILMAVMAALGAGYSLYVSASLPDVVPVHWNIQGQPDGWGPKWMSLWLMPGIIAFLAALTWVLPKVSPKAFDVERFGGVFNYVMVLASGLMFGLHLSILHATASGEFELGRLFLVLLGLFFAMLGNVLGKVRRNFWVGIRTPWTLGNEQVWDKTHRAAGRLWFLGGLFIAILAALGVRPEVVFVVTMVVALWPVVQSFLIWRQVEGGAA